MNNRSVLERSIGATQITTRGIRWAFAVVLIILLMNVYMVISFSTSPLGTSDADWVYLAVISCLAVPLVIGLGWLGFSRRGIELTDRSLAQGGVENRYYRFVKISTGAVGFAGIPWMLSFVVLIITNNTDSLDLLFKPWVISGLVLVCFPIAARYMK